jgi:hypothetical protein
MRGREGDRERTQKKERTRKCRRSVCSHALSTPLRSLLANIYANGARASRATAPVARWVVDSHWREDQEKAKEIARKLSFLSF